MEEIYVCMLMTLLYNGKEIYEWFPCASQEFVIINPNHNGGGREWQPTNLSCGHTDQAQSWRDDQLWHVQKAHAYRLLPAVLFSPPLPCIGRLVLLQSTLLREMLNITTDMYREVWCLASFTGPGRSRMEKPEREKDTSFRYCRMDTCMKWSGLPQSHDCQGQMRTKHTTPSTSPTYVSRLSKDLRRVRREDSITAVFRAPSTRREKKLSRINQRSCNENNCKTPCSCGQRYIRKQWGHWRQGWRNIGQPHKGVKQTYSISNCRACLVPTSPAPSGDKDPSSCKPHWHFAVLGSPTHFRQEPRGTIEQALTPWHRLMLAASCHKTPETAEHNMQKNPHGHSLTCIVYD